MFIRKQLVKILGVNEPIMNEAMQIKKLSRQKDNQEFDCFVIDVEAVAPFFTKLNKNLKDLENARFQIAIKKNMFGLSHWWMVDCYIKDGILHTFTLDAAALRYTLLPMLRTLSDCVPDGKHYAFYRLADASAIQSTLVHCQTFTREHVAQVSKMEPNELYTMLDENTRQVYLPKKEDSFDPEDRKRNNLKIFKFDDLNSEMSLLAPVFRSIQSLYEFSKFPPELKTATVTKKRTLEDEDITLGKWVEENTVEVTKIDSYSHQPCKINQNHSIEKKQAKYLKALSDNNTNFTNDRSGFGFISFPILNKIKHHWKNSEITIQQLQEVTRGLISELKKAPKFTKKASFLAIPAAHAEVTEGTIISLEELRDDPNDNKADYIRKFCDIIYKYAGYLDQHNSDRTLTLLRNYFVQYENTLKLFSNKL